MTPLNNDQRQLLLDYSLGLTSDAEAVEVERLIQANDEAAELHSLFHGTLAPLEAVQVEPCPEELTERLFFRLGEVSQSGAGQARLGQLLEAEQTRPRTVRIPLWRNWGEALAAAAIILLFLSVLFPTTGYMRHRYGVSRCGTQLGSIYGGLQNYASDHDDLMPAVAMSPGQPWWKVGYQGREDYSNTRPLWLLAKHEYVEPSVFLCPGRDDGRKVTFDGFNVQDFNDFPSRLYIHFSFRIPVPKSGVHSLTQMRVLMADRNPLAERMPADHSASFALKLCKEMMEANSRNHEYRGQNALIYDGSVEYTRSRHTSISNDDIYTIKGMSCGKLINGCEFPTSLADIFLAP